MRPATDEEKRLWLSMVSFGLTRGRFHNMPLEAIPLYMDGDTPILLEKGR